MKQWNEISLSLFVYWSGENSHVPSYMCTILHTLEKPVRTYT